MPRWVGLLDAARQDLRSGFRGIRKFPARHLVVVASLALAIGATAAILGLIDALLLRPLPVHDPDQLVQVVRPTGPGSAQETFDTTIFQRFQESSGDLAELFVAGYPADVVLSAGSRENQLENARLAPVSGNAFRILGVTPIRGRLIEEQDAIKGAEPVAVISYNYWRQRFGARESVLRESLFLKNNAIRIVGVVKAGFEEIDRGSSPDIWTAMPAGQSGRILARLRPNTSSSQFLAFLQVRYDDYLRSLRQDSSRGNQLQLLPAGRGISGTGLRGRFSSPLIACGIAVVLLLLVACSNAAIMLLASGAARRREMATRLALGARRSRIVQQMLTETMLLTGGGCLLGLLLAQWLSSVLVTLISDPDKPVRLALSPDLRMLGLSCFILAVTTLLAGLVPAFRAPTVDIAEAMHGGGAVPPKRRGKLRLDEAFVVIQVVVSLTLLAGAGLLLSTWRNLSQTNTGFSKNDVLIAELEWLQRGEDRAYTDAIYKELMDRLSRVSQVTSVSFSGWSYFGSNSRRAPIVVEGEGRAEENPPCEFLSVGPGFFQTMGTLLLQGREFSNADTERSAFVAIVNESAARAYFGARDPIGRQFHIFDPKERIEIVGVVRDTKLNSVRAAAPPMIYLPFLQSQFRGTSDAPASVEIRSAAGLVFLGEALRRELRAASPNLTIKRLRSQRELIDKHLLQERMLAATLLGFASLAFFLAMIGLYAVVNCAAEKRTKEIGVRSALGATMPQLFRMVLSESVFPVLIGVAAGLPVALGAARLLKGFLFGIPPWDPVTFAGASALLIAAAFVAAWQPAWRASHLNPLMALRYE